MFRIDVLWWRGQAGADRFFILSITPDAGLYRQYAWVGAGASNILNGFPPLMEGPGICIVSGGGKFLEVLLAGAGRFYVLRCLNRAAGERLGPDSNGRRY